MRALTISEAFFLVAVCIIALALVLLATRSGPGVNPDATTYISMAENIVHGRGFVTNLSGPFDAEARGTVNIFAPGYSVLVAALIEVGIASVSAARFAPALSLCVLLLAVYWCGRLLSGRQVAILSTVLVLFFTPVFRWSTFALSETTFTALSLLSFNCMLAWLLAAKEQESGRRWLILSAILAGAATLTRYVGIVWLGAGTLTILLAGRRDIRPAISDTLLYVLLVSGMIVPWFARNLLQTGQWTGMDRATGYHPSFVTNVNILLTTVAEDLAPSYHFGLREMAADSVALIALVLASTVTVLTVLILKRAGKNGIAAFLAQHRSTVIGTMGWVFVVYIVSYVGLIFLASNIRQFPPYDWPRYLSPVYPMLLVLLLGLLATVIQSATKTNHQAFAPALLTVFVLLAVVPNGIETLGFARAASTGQELTQRIWQDNQGLAYFKEFATENDIIYSDKPFAVAYYLQRPARYLPYTDDKEGVERFLSRPLRDSGNEYIIAFKGETSHSDPYFRPRLGLEILMANAVQGGALTIVMDFEDATIFTFAGDHP